MPITIADVVAEADRLFAERYHCSEAITIATTGYYLEEIPDILIRASCPFGGGVGGCRDELCGLLSGATLVLGALWGRTSSQEDDKWLYDVVCEYRRRFQVAFGDTICRPLREPFEETGARCDPLVRDATAMLVRLIEDVADRRPDQAQRLAQRVTDQTVSFGKE